MWKFEVAEQFGHEISHSMCLFASNVIIITLSAISVQTIEFLLSFFVYNCNDGDTYMARAPLHGYE